MRFHNLLAIVALAAWAAAAPAAVIGPVALDDLNSHVEIDPTSPSGMVTWSVDGVDHLATQTFYYRIGSTGPILPLAGLPLTATRLLDANFDPGDDTLLLRYAGTGFTVTSSYMLKGGQLGSLTSDIAEQLSFDNTSAGPLSIQVFQYTNLLLNSTPNDTLQLLGGNTAQQSDALTFAEVVATPRPTHYQAGTAPLDLAALSDYAGPAIGNAAYAFQWDRTIPAGGSFILSFDKQLYPVPEPAAISALAPILLALRRICRRQMRKNEV